MKSVSGKNNKRTGKEFIERKKAESCMIAKNRPT